MSFADEKKCLENQLLVNIIIIVLIGDTNVVFETMYAQRKKKKKEKIVTVQQRNVHYSCVCV